MRPGISPKVDYVFKRLFAVESNWELLKHLLNAILQPQFGDVVREGRVTNPFKEKEFSDDKLAIYDVRALDQANRQYLLEMQQITPFFLGMRAEWTVCGAHAAQIREGEHYVLLQQTQGIWFLGDNYFDDRRWCHRFRFVDEETNTPLTDRLALIFFELDKFTMPAEDVKTPLEHWLCFFRDAHLWDSDNLPLPFRQPIFLQAWEVLMNIFENETDRQAYFTRLKASLDHASLRMPLADAQRFGHEMGVKEGRKEGLKEGLKEGHKEGHKEGLKEGHKEGFKEGELKGEVIGSIRLAQRSLKQAQTPREELGKLPLEELQSLWQTLEKQAYPEE